jgi:hypothetical protein
VVAVPKRLAPLTLAAVALALTLTGVIYAATDSNPGAIPKDPLVLNGYPPTSAQFALKVSTGQAYSLNANVDVNFKKNQVQAQLLIPLLFSAATVDLRLTHGHLYVGSPNLSSIFGKDWIGTKLHSPSLFGLSLELTKPDISLISGFSHESVTKDGYLTTYRYQRDNVILGTTSKSPIKMPSAATVKITITVGSQGELTAATVSETSRSSTLVLDLNVLSYNQPVHVLAPTAKDVKRVNVSQLLKLLKATPLKSVLSKNFGIIGKTQVS